MSRLGSADRWSVLLLLISVGCAGSVAVFVGSSASTSAWAVGRLGWSAVLMLLAGALVGSERLIGASTGPVALGLVVAAWDQTQPAWAASLVVGCVWFVAVEAALASVECRSGPAHDAAVLMRRVVEMATVVALSAALVLTALALTSFAPERSVLVRAAVAAAVLTGLFVVGRRLADGGVRSRSASR